MGYTHYWYRPKEIPPEVFKAIVSDFKTILNTLEGFGLKLAGGNGTGEPEINDEVVCFNGSKLCGHPKNPNLIIPWPTPDAWGLGPSEHAIKGDWHGGVLINTRTCNGDCSYETFYFPRVFDKPYASEYRWNGKEYWFDFCKTAYRPYDLAVNCFLIIVKHYLKEDLIVHSDGSLMQWADAMAVCQDVLGYGNDFGFDGGVQPQSVEGVKGLFIPPDIVEMSYDKKIKIIRKALKSLCKTLSVKRGGGTAYPWVEISGSLEFGEFTEEEKRALEVFGLNYGGNLALISPENRDYYTMRAISILREKGIEVGLVYP
jgi:hypothetical protein